MCWGRAITMRWLDSSVLLSFLLPCVRCNVLFFILTFLALQCSKDPFTWKLSSRCSFKPLPTSPSLTLFPSSCLTADYSFSLLSSLIVLCFHRYALFRMSRYHGLLVLPATLLSSLLSFFLLFGFGGRTHHVPFSISQSIPHRQDLPSPFVSPFPEPWYNVAF